jgi:hypothetical protein
MTYTEEASPGVLTLFTSMGWHARAEMGGSDTRASRTAEIVRINGVVRVFIIFPSVGCDICPARLLFLARIQVLLPRKAEMPFGSRHDCALFSNPGPFVL